MAVIVTRFINFILLLFQPGGECTVSQTLTHDLTQYDATGTTPRSTTT